MAVSNFMAISDDRLERERLQAELDTLKKDVDAYDEPWIALPALFKEVTGSQSVDEAAVRTALESMTGLRTKLSLMKDNIEDHLRHSGLKATSDLREQVHDVEEHLDTIWTAVSKIRDGLNAVQDDLEGAVGQESRESLKSSSSVASRAQAHWRKAAIVIKFEQVLFQEMMGNLQGLFEEVSDLWQQAGGQALRKTSVEERTIVARIEEDEAAEEVVEKPILGANSVQDQDVQAPAAGARVHVKGGRHHGKEGEVQNIDSHGNVEILFDGEACVDHVKREHYDKLEVIQAVVDKPGAYLITHDVTPVTSESSRESAIICSLKSSTHVEVLEVITIPEEKLIRARIKDPEGWISLRNTETGESWAKAARSSATIGVSLQGVGEMLPKRPENFSGGESSPNCRRQVYRRQLKNQHLAWRDMNSLGDNNLNEESESSQSERRIFGRNQLQLPSEADPEWSEAAPSIVMASTLSPGLPQIHRNFDLDKKAATFHGTGFFDHARSGYRIAHSRCFTERSKRGFRKRPQCPLPHGILESIIDERKRKNVRYLERWRGVYAYEIT
jgi:hypothetical protein